MNSIFHVFGALLVVMVSAHADVAFVSGDFELHASLKLDSVSFENGPLPVPIVSWAADAVTIQAHGGTLASKRSALAKAMGVEVELQMVDDFDQQIADFVEGHSPFLRGSLGQIILAADYLKRFGADAEPIVFLLVSWSAGADGVVVRAQNGRKHSWVVQRKGRQLDLLPQLARKGIFDETQHQLRFVREAMFHPAAAMDGKCHDPIQALKQDASLTAALGLTHEIGKNQLTPTVTTEAFPRALADVYAVRADFLEHHPEIVGGMLRAQSEAQAAFPGQMENGTWFRDTGKDMAGVFLNDEGRADEFATWMNGVDLPGRTGNQKFLEPGNSAGGTALSRDLREYFHKLGLVKTKTPLKFFPSR
tara:strand:+ start:7421 stop:8509 length:1089 start_codon:yes stop_codon:yes gene_type:complete